MKAKVGPAVIAGLPRLLTTVQVAEALGVDSSTLSRWRSRGVGPRVYWLGKASPRYREQDVLEWVDAQYARRGTPRDVLTRHQSPA